METAADTGCTVMQVVSYKILLFHIVTSTGYALSPAMNKSLHAALIKICTSGGDPLSHSCINGVVIRKMLLALVHLSSA
jgi:hypothetical protein